MIFFSHQLFSCIQWKRIFLHHIICWTLWQLRKPQGVSHTTVAEPTRILFCVSDIAMQWQRSIIPISAHMDYVLILAKIIIRFLMYKIKAMELHEVGTFWQGSATTSWRSLLLITYCSQYEGAWTMMFINTSVAFFHMSFKWSQWKSWES